MPLRDYQTQINLGTLYECRAKGGSEQRIPSIEIIGGTADVYCSQTKPTGVAPAGMTVMDNGSGIVGTIGFEFVPAFLYVVQKTATVSSVVLSGIDAQLV